MGNISLHLRFGYPGMSRRRRARSSNREKVGVSRARLVITMPILRFRFTAALVAMSVGFEPALLAVDSKAAAYIGGTAAQFSATTGPLDGILDTRSQADLAFWPDESPFRDMPLKIPYKAITELEYG